MSSVIGKDEFRNFALGIIENRLIKKANLELNSLCEGRYKIIQASKKTGHDFHIIDNWKGGLSRKISTLSGGETFLVSLAMALALSEMTRGQVEIESFFIDEGFGNLDNESIEDVLDVLSKVRSRGKQIGLISHIKTLTDRIPVNISISKSHLGESTVYYNYN